MASKFTIWRPQILWSSTKAPGNRSLGQKDIPSSSSYFQTTHLPTSPRHVGLVPVCFWDLFSSPRAASFQHGLKQQPLAEWLRSFNEKIQNRIEVKNNIYNAKSKTQWSSSIWWYTHVYIVTLITQKTSCLSSILVDNFTIEHHKFKKNCLTSKYNDRH